MTPLSGHISFWRDRKTAFRMTRVAWVGILLICGLSTAGCASTRLQDSSAQLPSGFPNHSAAQILDRLPGYPTEMNRVTAQSRIALSSPEEKGRFTAKIAYLHPESLFVRVTFPLGIEGARVLSTPDRAWVYDRVEKVVWTGSPERVAAVLPGAVAGTDLVQLATGFDQPLPDVDWAVSTDSTLYLLTHPDGSLRYTVDPTLWRVVSVRTSDATGMVLEQRWYTDFREVEGILLPRRMALSRPLDSLRISMALERITLDPRDALEFDLDVSSEAQWIDLGE